VLLVVLLLALIGGSGWLAASHLLAEHHLGAAREAMSRRRLTQAREHLDRVFRYRPGNVEAHLLAARLARWLDKPQEAERLLDRCRQLEKGETEDIQLERYLVRAQFGDLDAVYAHLWSYVAQKKPQAPLVLEALCRGHLAVSQLFQARSAALRWQDLTPDDPQAYYCEGLVHQRTGAQVLAKDCFVRALELDPERVEARLKLAQVRLEMNEEKEAAELYTAVLRQDPEQREALLGLARCHRGLGRLGEARRLLEGLVGSGENVAELAELGYVALDEGKFSEAERLLRRALALDPLDHRARFQLMVCLRRLGRAEEARREDQMQRQVEKDLRRIQALVTKGMKVSPRDPRLHYEVATLLYRHGQKRAAAQWLYSTLKYAPQHRPSHALLAAYHRERKDAEMAEYHQSQAGGLTLDSPAPF
jgi:Flp pilus assembly protein TadD